LPPADQGPNEEASRLLVSTQARRGSRAASLGRRAEGETVADVLGELLGPPPAREGQTGRRLEILAPRRYGTSRAGEARWAAPGDRRHGSSRAREPAGGEAPREER